MGKQRCLPFNWRRRSCLPHLLAGLLRVSDQEGGDWGGPHEPSRNGPRKIIVYGPLHYHDCPASLRDRLSTPELPLPVRCHADLRAMRGDEQQMPAQPMAHPSMPTPTPLRDEEAAERRLARVASFLSP